MITLSLLGPFQANVAGRPLTQFGAKKAKALLIYLAVEPRIHQREYLMALLWTGLPLNSAQQNLRQTLYLLRQALAQGENEQPAILAERFTLAWNPKASLSLDITSFEKLASPDRTVPEWQQAADLYRGDFLTDFFLPDSEPFEAWVANRRASYQHTIQDVLRRLASHFMAARDWKAAEKTVRRRLELDNLQETAHRQLIEVLALDGRRQGALLHFETMRRLLADELALDPEPETIALVEAIRAGNIHGKAGSKPRDFAQPGLMASSSSLSRHNLPSLLTTFFGRGEEQDEIAHLLVKNRLVTLIGTGGIGKTTLSLQLGQKLLGKFPDGVWFVELASLNNPSLVPQAVASILGISSHSNRPLVEHLQDVLRPKTMLILFDNCEHLLGACVQLADVLLRHCPYLKILATSREALGVPGEVLYNLPPLPFPDSSRVESVKKLNEYPSSRLFVERARLVREHFSITKENAPFIRDICRQLDGLPLAIELAASRVNLFSVDQIATRLKQSFHLLTRGSKTTLARHKTMQASIEWSWNLLSEPERILFRRLSVFSGGWTLEAAEIVCSGEGVSRENILELLSSLANKSLIQVARKTGLSARYRLLETVRQYAQDRLLEAGGRDIFRNRHIDYFLKLGERAEKELVGPDQAAWLHRLERELDNLRVAMGWASEANIEKGLRLAKMLWNFWSWHGYAREGVAWLSQMLAQSATVAPALKAKALCAQGALETNLYNFDHGHTLLEESLALYQALENQQGIALNLYRLGRLVGLQGQAILGRKYLSESLAIYRSLADKLGAANTLEHLGYFENHNDYEQACKYLEESQALYQELGHLAGTASVLRILGELAMWQGDYMTAQSSLEKSLDLSESLALQGGEHGSVVWSLSVLGLLHFRLGDYEQARDYLEKSLSNSQQTGEKLVGYWERVHLGYISLRMGKIAQARAIFVEGYHQFKEEGKGNPIGVIFTLEGLASVATGQEQFLRATKLFAWADTMRKQILNTRPHVEQVDVDNDVANIIKKISEAAFSAAYEEGKKMTMDEASALALEE